MHWATLNQHATVVSILLNAKVNVNCKDLVSYVITLLYVFPFLPTFQYSKTPLHYATANANYQLLALLIEHGADIDLNDGVSY